MPVWCSFFENWNCERFLYKRVHCGFRYQCRDVVGRYFEREHGFPEEITDLILEFAESDPTPPDSDSEDWIRSQRQGFVTVSPFVF